MPAVAITLLFALCVTGLARLALRSLTKNLDPAAEFGIAGLAGLGAIGWLTLFVGLVPGGLQWGWVVPALVAAAGIAAWIPQLRSKGVHFAKLDGLEWFWPVALAIPVLFALVGVLAPSDRLDWDSLSYHLAVPKLWLAAGQIYYIPFLHHSNFPFVVDNLYVWGLMWGGQQGAKAFQPAFLLLGLSAIFGLARQCYGRRAGMWASAAFVGIPVVVWEAGTGYIDVAHGLYAGLGAALVAIGLTAAWGGNGHEGSARPGKETVLLGALLLGFAVGSKYTGLQVVIAVGLAAVFVGIAARRTGSAVKAAIGIGAIACVVGCPWYIKNAIWVGNPVYPFFYEHFGGKSWDQRRADIYRIEQESFGVGRVNGRLQPESVGHAVFGLAYQPGRYINPGQQQGEGFPQGAVGVVVLCGALAWLFSGRSKRFEASLLLFAGLSFLMWFALSQQSRYVLGLAPPLCLLAGGAIVRLRWGPLLAGIAALQSVYTLGLIRSELVDDQLPVVLGRVAPEDYQARHIPFYRPSVNINEAAKGGKVAMYDDTFGFLLDVPYFWANPSHCMVIPYDSLQNGDQYAEEMKREGFTHVYVNLAAFDPRDAGEWLAAAGLTGPATPYSKDRRQGITGDWQIKWRVLIAEAVALGRLKPIRAYGGERIRAVLLETAR